tara:strand:+ start:36 stop:386 length:351 start_codon:yes stop_codon:yes gene_type:complete
MEYFKDKFSFDDRLQESIRIIAQYPNRIPVIIEKSKISCDIPNIDKIKYLVPKDITYGYLYYIIRNRLKLSQDKAIFLFCNNIIPNNSQLIETVYNNNKDKDGFLYITYSGENTFG